MNCKIRSAFMWWTFDRYTEHANNFRNMESDQRKSAFNGKRTDKYGKSCNKSTKLSITCNHINYNKFKRYEWTAQRKKKFYNNSNVAFGVMIKWSIVIVSFHCDSAKPERKHRTIDFVQNQHYFFVYRCWCCCRLWRRCCGWYLLHFLIFRILSFYLQFAANVSSHTHSNTLPYHRSMKIAWKIALKYI